MIRTATTLLIVVLAAGMARADPVLDRVESRLSRNRRLTVTVEASFGGRGELRLEGDVNGRAVHLRKRVRKAGTRRLRVNLDPRRLRLRRVSEPLDFDLMAVAEEQGGARTEQAVRRTVPVPVIVLPGLGNEFAPGATGAFATALDLATGGGHVTTGRHPTLAVYEYPSFDGSLRAHAKGLHKRIRKMLRGSTFRKVDVVGYSMGGLVVRRLLADRGGKDMRRVVFLATPNEGATLAAIASIGLQGNALTGLAEGIAPGLGDLGAFADLLGAAGRTETARETLRTLQPTYPWAFVTVDVPLLGSQRLAITPQLLQTFGTLVPGLGDLPLDLSSPLTPLNELPPPADVDFFAIGYSGVLPEVAGTTLGTVDEIDLTPVLSGGSFDPLTLASGEGDGIVPWRSVAFDDTPAWAARTTVTDLGDGTHVTLLADVRAIARVAAVLSE